MDGVMVAGEDASMSRDARLAEERRQVAEHPRTQIPVPTPLLSARSVTLVERLMRNYLFSFYNTAVLFSPVPSFPHCNTTCITVQVPT